VTKPESCRIVYKEASGFQPEPEAQRVPEAIESRSYSPFKSTESRVPGRFVAPPEPARKDPKQKEGTGGLGSYAAAFGDFTGAPPHGRDQRSNSRGSKPDADLVGGFHGL